MKPIFIFLLFIFSGLHSYSQLDTISNLSNTEKIYGLSLFWKEAAYNFAYFDKAKINWDSTYQAFIPKVLETKSTYEYYRVLQRFCALLKDGHTNVFPPFLSKGSTNTQVHFQYLEGKIVVQNVILEDSLLAPIGSEVISVNDIPTQKYLDTEVLPYISSSTKHWLYHLAVSRMYPNDTTKSIVLKLKTPSGNSLSYTTRLTSKFKRMAFDYRFPKFTVYKELPGNIIYINLYSFQDTSIISMFKKYLPQLYKANGIVLDLRLNGGGNSEIGVEILKYFTSEKQIVGTAGITPEHIAAFKAWGNFIKPDDLKDTVNKTFQEKELMIKSYKAYRNDLWYYLKPDVFQNNISGSKINAPLVVLIGNETASAAEDFLVILENLKGRAVTIGEITEGSTGQPLYFNLPGGGRARICTLRETYPDGREFVGYGIKPDIEVPRTIKSLIEGRDLQLEKAIEILNRKAKIN